MSKQHEVEVNSLKEPEVASQSAMPPVPPRPIVSTGRKDIMAMHKYYVANRDAILADLAELGQQATMRRWGIPSCGTVAAIRHGWTKSYWKPWPKKANVGDDGLPPFPPFESNWPEAVQLCWLDIYREIVRGATGGGKEGKE